MIQLIEVFGCTKTYKLEVKILKIVEKPSNDQSSSLIQSKAELDQLKIENERLHHLLLERSDELAISIQNAKEHSDKFLSEKERSEKQFREMYNQLEAKSKSTQDSLNNKIG